MNLKFWICLGLASCLLFSQLPVIADPDIVPSEVFLVVLLKALNYDRKIDRLAQGKVVIGVVYLNGDGQAQNFSQKIKGNFADVQSTAKLKELPAEIQTIGLDKTIDGKTFGNQLKQGHISVVVVANQDQDINKVIFDTTRSLGIDSVCYSSECVKQGGGLGIVPNENKSKILVNMASVSQEGSDYSGQFLSICEAVK